MNVVLKITGTSAFPLAAGEIEFTDREVDVVEIVPERNQTLSFSQSGDLTIYQNGQPHNVLAVTFIVETFQTLVKLSEIREHQAPLTLYPSMRDDDQRQFEVLWINPNDMVERLRRGFLVLGYAFVAQFREPLGEVCRPPEVTS